RASPRSSSQSIRPRTNRDLTEVTDRQMQRLVRAFRAIRSVRLRASIVSFAEAVALPKRFHGQRRKGD
ncbi:MAG TPA: hypothetical protein VE567_01070, partial [Sphingomonas sp.]|nr:hypothetical protein [Sphingomonas sp.]